MSQTNSGTKKKRAGKGGPTCFHRLRFCTPNNFLLTDRLTMNKRTPAKQTPLTPRDWPEELTLYRNHLEGNQPHTLTYKGTEYTFQFHGPNIGTTGNWLEVTREDGKAMKFGAGHGPEWVWRAFHHIDQGWDTPQIPRYRQEPVLTNLEKRGFIL